MRGQSWALERLQPFAGKTAQFRVSPFSFIFLIQENGELGVAPEDTVPDVTLSLTPGILLRILAADEAAMNLVDVSGNTSMAAEIGYIAKNVKWDIEEDLSHVFGDILAHRLVQAGETFWKWRKQSIFGVAQTLVEYWTEERPLLAKPLQVQRYIREVDLLRDDTERLEKRIARLEAK